MGCDIHMFVEVRTKDGTWEYQKKKFKNDYYDPEAPNKVDEDGFEWNPEYQDEPYSGRGYDTFAILANVRNGYGFAGVNTGEGFVPIAMPKGVPSDASPEYLQKVEDYGTDGHSHSYLTVKEILDYNWDQKTSKKGVVSLPEYLNIKGEGWPSSWCGSVSGIDVHIVRSFADKKLLLLGHKPESIGIPKEKHVYVEHEWHTPYREASIYFLETVLPRLQALGNPEDVRIVFYFDN